MVSSLSVPRDSLRETLPSRRAPQRRSTAPATVLACVGPQYRAWNTNSWHALEHKVLPNPSLERTTSGMPRKPAVFQFVYRHTSGLRGTPPGSAQLER
jgi:hypothetical protein